MKTNFSKKSPISDRFHGNQFSGSSCFMQTGRHDEANGHILETFCCKHIKNVLSRSKDLIKWGAGTSL
jgi:hypothetical protein